MEHTLWKLRRGQHCILENFAERLNPVYRARLEELGFQPGATVACVAAPRLGAPKLFQVDNTVYSLEKPVANLIRVRSLSS